jgi:hypothetical protein
MMDRSVRHTGAVHEDEDEDETPDPDETEPRPRPRSAGSTVLGAAMLGVGRVLEPDKTEVQIEILAPGDPDDQPFDLDFGDLPPLT